MKTMQIIYYCINIKYPHNYIIHTISEISEGQKYITTQNYTAKDEDEISLPSGVTVQVVEKSFSGWWKVK